MGMDSAERSLPIPKPIALPQPGQHNLNGSKISSKIFEQFAKLGGETYVFYIVGNKGQEIIIPQSQLLQLVNGLKKESERQNLLRFFNSTNLARLSRLPQGHIYKINLSPAIASAGGDPIKVIEESVRTSTPSKVKLVESGNRADAAQNSAKSIGSDEGTIYTFPTSGLVKMLEDLGLMEPGIAKSVRNALRGA